MLSVKEKRERKRYTIIYIKKTLQRRKAARFLCLREKEVKRILTRYRKKEKKEEIPPRYGV